MQNYPLFLLSCFYEARKQNNMIKVAWDHSSVPAMM
jgi:hypothetical protein